MIQGKRSVESIYYDKNNRDSAILYINNEIFEGKDHWGMLENYVINNLGAKTREELNKTERISDHNYEMYLTKMFDQCNYALGNKVGKQIFFEMK